MVAVSFTERTATEGTAQKASTAGTTGAVAPTVSATTEAQTTTGSVDADLK